MARIHAEGVVVDFPIFEANSRSIKNAFIRAATGGVLSMDDERHVVIVRALDQLSFDLREGDRVGLIGHNGSGKSTLLRVLAGVYEPVRGRIEVTGKVASMLNVWLGMNMDATGYENIFLRATVMGMRRAQIEPMVDDICDFADLGGYIHMPLRTYSSGMQMRLSFAIATSVTADIILMDEWLSAGDASFADKARDRLDRMLDRARIFVVASHNETLVKQTCNKIMRLDHGKLISIEPLEPERAAAATGEQLG